MKVETDIASIAVSPKRTIYDTSDYVCQGGGGHTLK
jgi:hypothetical protein